MAVSKNRGILLDIVIARGEDWNLLFTMKDKLSDGTVQATDLSSAKFLWTVREGIGIAATAVAEFTEISGEIEVVSGIGFRLKLLTAWSETLDPAKEYYHDLWVLVGDATTRKLRLVRTSKLKVDGRQGNPLPA